jgi:hypothetical protein
MKLAIFLLSLLLLVMGVLPELGRSRIVPPDTSESRLSARVAEDASARELQPLVEQSISAARSRQKHLETLLTWINILGISGGLVGMFLLSRSSAVRAKPSTTQPA